MNRRIISCQVNNEYVQGSGVVVGAAGSHDDVVLRLTFNDMWDGLTKKITWLDALDENPVLTILTTNMLEPGSLNTYLVPIPSGPKAHEGKMTLTIKGVVVEDGVETVATLSVTTQFTVLPSAWDPDAEEEADIPAGQAAQIQAEIDDIKETIVDAREAASAAAGSAAAAAGSAVAAAGSAAAAAGSAAAAAGSAAAAAGSVAAAVGSAAAAAGSAAAAESAKDTAVAALEAFQTPMAEAQTLQSGQDATASYDGQKFIFGIPKGIQGIQREQGPQGPQGSQGIQGPAGSDGAPGADGQDGKSAYASAIDGGYTGTEAQFNSDLAAVSSKIPDSEKGVANGVATLGSDGKIPSTQLDIENAAIPDSTKPITSGAVYSILGTVEAELAAI